MQPIILMFLPQALNLSMSVFKTRFSIAQVMIAQC